MSSLFIEYPKCTTCQKAKKWLDEQGISYEDRHIVEQNPTAEELRSWIEGSGLPAKKFFNTSGLLYKSMKLKDKLAGMSQFHACKPVSPLVSDASPMMVAHGMPARR